MDGSVYNGSQNGIVYTLNAKDGMLRWHYESKGDMDSAPVVVDGIVYASSCVCYLFWQWRSQCVCSR